MSTKNLKELFESSVLDEETKTALQEAFDAKVEAVKEEQETKHAEKLVEAREEMQSMLPEIVSEALEMEMSELKTELAEARDLEVKYAEKLVEFKEAYAVKAAEKIDEAVTAQVRTELDELKESIEEARKNTFAKKMYEAYRDMFNKEFGTEVNEGADAEDLQSKLQEAEAKVEEYQRKELIEGLLEGLTGRRRKAVRLMLEDTATDKLESRFDRIMEGYNAESDNGDENLTESDNSGKSASDKEDIDGTVIIESDVNESDTSKSKKGWSQKSEMFKALAGL